MLKKLGIAGVVLLLIILVVKIFFWGAKTSDLPVKLEPTSYISNPPSSSIIEKNIADLKKEISILENIEAQKVYDYLSVQKKEITDKNLLEIYYTVLSFLRVQSNAVPAEQFRKKLDSLLDSVAWLYCDHENEKFSDRVTKLGRLLNSDVFIHLSIQKMSECLDIAHNLKSIVEYSNLGNDFSPEDGPDYFSPDFFLNKEIETAQQIYNQVLELENQSQSFSKDCLMDCATLSKQQLIDNIGKANDFINGLQSATIEVGSEKVKISRNTRKHLKNLASSSIEKLVEQRNKVEY
ncbi:MAG: hypothetical protein K5766_01230 [Alphaproteobacteria bacterium]|nr:hypothetical protein [Alphaproteobacteria bacterium]